MNTPQLDNQHSESSSSESEEIRLEMKETQATVPAESHDQSIEETVETHKEAVRESSGKSRMRQYEDGFYFQWSDIDYHVTQGIFEKTTTQIMKDVSGMARPGRILGIMGPSGAGKTSLLDILSGTISSKSFSGNISINGIKKSKIKHSQLSSLISYVGQEDALHPLLSIRETFRYSAQLRLPELNSDEIEIQVEKVLNDLGLQKVADSKVGNALIRGVSGGERRRVSIGIETVIEPQIIFLDEPTSGLDSFSAVEVIRSLRDLAAQNKTIILTIHQPSSMIWKLIDDVALLVRGQVAYHGSREKMDDFFNFIEQPIPAQTNPADHAIEVLQQFDRENKVDDLHQQFINYEKKAMTKSAVLDVPLSTLSEIPDSFTSNFLTQWLVLTWINFRNSYRQKEEIMVNLFLYTFFSTVLGSAFINVGYSGDAPNEIAGFFIFLLAMVNFTSVQNLPLFLDRKLIFLREYRSGYYTIPIYIIAEISVYMFFALFIATGTSIPGYFMLGLHNTADSFFSFLFIVYCDLMVAQSIVLLISAITPSAATGNSAASSFFAFQFLFSGFFLARENIPDWWIWMHYISVFKYALEGFIQNQFDNDNKYGCTDIQKSLAGTSNCKVDSRDVLDSFQTDGLDPRIYALILLGLSTTYYFVLYLVLRLKGTSRS